jgi:peptide/nickel transport system substrate-binding protein
MVTQFEAGALDAMKSAPPRDFIRLKADSTYESVVHPYTGAMYFVGINVLSEPLDNKKVRQAMNYALDRKRFTDTVMGGMNGQPYSLPWPADSLAYEEQKRNFYSFDLDKAKALLREAGASTFELDFVTQSSPPELVEFAAVYQADLRSIGIAMETKVVDPATWQGQVTARKYPGKYAFAATYSMAQLRSPTMMYTSGPAWSTDAAVNQQGFASDRYAQLVTASTTESDVSRQRQIFSQINDLVLDESFFIPLAPSPPRVTLHGVQGVAALLHEAFSYTDAWLSA